MNTQHSRRDQDTNRRETAPASAPTTLTAARRAWKRPEFTEVAACAEICAYVFHS